jgi:hypothetical protein
VSGIRLSSRYLATWFPLEDLYIPVFVMPPSCGERKHFSLPGILIQINNFQLKA